MSTSTKEREAYVFDVYLPISLCIDTRNPDPEAPEPTKPPKPLSLASVNARISYTTGHRLRISINDQLIIDRRSAEPSGDLFNFGRLDKIMGPTLRKKIGEGLTIRKGEKK